jgi:hypothetical protein
MPSPTVSTGDALRGVTGSNETWQQYCGFLDLSVPEYMQIQERLLLEQIGALHGSILGRKIIGDRRPGNIQEFRENVPITIYEDYNPHLVEKREDSLPEKPYCWAYTSGRSGTPKYVPFTRRAYDRITDDSIGIMILACARNKGDVRVHRGMKVVYNLPPRPYFSGYIAASMTDKMDLRFLPPVELAEKMQFEDRIKESFKLALREGVDYVGSQTSVLIKIAESFASQSSSINVKKLISQPGVLFRGMRGKARAKLANRPMLPKDLWNIKAVVCYGMDTAAYKTKLADYWGVEPYEFYGSTEAGAAAIQAWNHKGLYFNPFSCFYEFIPESEVAVWLKDPVYRPQSYLISEVKPGERYELFISSFYGMPFVRYRMEDIFEVESLTDTDTGIRLPQFVFSGRSRDLIDLAGFAQLGEKDIWLAIARTGIGVEDWSARKEIINNETVLRIYLEPKDHNPLPVLEESIHKALTEVNWNYRDIDSMLKMKVLRVTALSNGTFKRYYLEKKAAGVALSQMKPPRMNAPDIAIEELLRSSASGVK